MGPLQAEAARGMGVHQIILSGMTPAAWRRAAKVADVVIDASQEDVYEAVQKAAPGGANKVLVSVGSGEVAQFAFRLVHRGGMMNLFAGLPRDTELKLNPSLVHYDEVTILGTFGFAPSHFHTAVKYLAEKKISTAGIITGTYPLTRKNSFTCCLSAKTTRVTRSNHPWAPSLVLLGRLVSRQVDREDAQ